MNLSDIAVLKIKNANYRCIITGIFRNEAIKLFKNIDFLKQVENYKHQEQF